MGSNAAASQSAAPALLALSAQSTLVRTALCRVCTSCDRMTPTPRVQPVEPVAGNPHGGFYEGGQAQAASTARPVPTHHTGFVAGSNFNCRWCLQARRFVRPAFINFDTGTLHSRF